MFLKGVVKPKMKIISSVTRPHVVPSLWDFISSVEQEDSSKKIRYLKYIYFILRIFCKLKMCFYVTVDEDCMVFE